VHLELPGAEVRAVNDGHSALRLLKTYHPQLVFLDIGMPGMDNFAVARAIRGMDLVVPRPAAVFGWVRCRWVRRTLDGAG
jgi:CheY-like chemotaxis protein